MAGKAKPRFVAHQKTFMAVEVLTKHEKDSKPFMRTETGTKATALGEKKAPKQIPENEEKA